MTHPLARHLTDKELTLDPRSDNARIAKDAAVQATGRLREIGRLLPDQVLSPGPIETDYWSFTLPLLTDGGRPAFFMKIPKSDLRLVQIRGALQDNASCVDGQNEYDSLSRLHLFGLSTGLPAIKPVLFLAEFNAIVTEFAAGDQLFERCRDSALWPHRNKAGTLALLTGAGGWLRRFHDATATSGSYQDHLGAALRECIAALMALQSKGIMRKECGELLSKLKIASVSSDDEPPVMSIPGFEVRNLLVTDRGAIPLDPGKLAPAPRAADLARFVVSMGMLFWGTPLFAAGLAAPQSQIGAFLSGYQENRFGSRLSDRIFLILEWTRLWSSGHLVLEQAKRYPAAVRWLAAREYVDRRFVSMLRPLVENLVKE